MALNLLGTFQLYNSLAALAAAHQMGVPYDDDHAAAWPTWKPCPAASTCSRPDRGFVVIVDYAHTVDALQKLLKSVNELEHRRVITVFGCGGDRDTTKRPLMGKAAEENSDLIIVTSDNPAHRGPGD